MKGTQEGTGGTSRDKGFNYVCGRHWSREQRLSIPGLDHRSEAGEGWGENKNQQL